MRLIAAALLALGMIASACSISTGPVAGATATSGTSAARIAGTKAADLRVRLDVLLGEQVFIVAKESAAAVNHSDDYVPYAALLTNNTAELGALLRLAFGDTAATQLMDTWSIQNGYLVDYAIGLVTHNQAKADGAMSGVENGFVPQMAQLVTSLIQLPQDPVAQLLTEQVLEIKVMIDDEAAGSFGAMYPALRTAYAQTHRLGDVLASGIAQKFPDKFPGDPSAGPVDSRVTLSVLLQESSYLSTMSTAAAAAHRDSERAAAVAALAANAAALEPAFGDVQGSSASARFAQAWQGRDDALVAYATSGDAAARQSLSQALTAPLSGIAHVPALAVRDQADATVKVVDDQRSGSSAAVAGDDRAAATAMQPIADALVEG
ncbi:MAG TPA: hypothetical protein VGG31_09775 [Candidatus Dormibacteraeota bacterium]